MHTWPPSACYYCLCQTGLRLSEAVLGKATVLPARIGLLATMAAAIAGRLGRQGPGGPGGRAGRAPCSPGPTVYWACWGSGYRGFKLSTMSWMLTLVATKHC